jgi:hypothetical protein
MKEPIMIYPDELSKEKQKFIENNNLDCFAFPRKYKDKFEMIVSILKTMVDNSNVGEKLDIDEKLASEFNRLLASLCYLINSTSYRKGKYFDFDKQEIDRKLLRKEKK